MPEKPADPMRSLEDGLRAAARSSRAWVRRLTLRHPPGTAPGTLAIDPEAPRPVIRVVAFGPEAFVEETVDDPAAIIAYVERWPVTWVNVDGLGDANVLNAIGERFNIHHLALADVVNVIQRPKIEAYGELLFVVMRMIRWNDGLDAEQLSLFLGRNFVLTFQESSGDVFDAVRDRIRNAHGRIRKSGADDLAYALIDAVIDGYYPVLESFGERIEALEDSVLERPEPSLAGEIHFVKRELFVLRRAVWPLRDAINALIRDESPLIDAETHVYLRDCSDHCVQLIDMLETYRELASGLMDMYLSAINNRTNEIVKVLTMFTVVFIPLGFIAGVYGMNFHTNLPGNMPELLWPFGYVFALAIMAVTAGGLLLYFRWKGWLGGPK